MNEDNLVSCRSEQTGEQLSSPNPSKGKHRRFGYWLNMRRRTLGISQIELAKKSNLGIATIQRWEQGDIGAKPAKLDQLADALEVSVAHLDMVFNRSKEASEVSDKPQEALLGLTTDQQISLLLTLCELTGTFVDHQDIEAELKLEYDAFKASAMLLARRMRGLAKPPALPLPRV